MDNQERERDHPAVPRGIEHGARHDNEQPILFYDGSPMHDYLAQVAPDEVPLHQDMRRSSSASISERSTGSYSETEGRMTGQPEGLARRRVRLNTAYILSITCQALTDASVSAHAVVASPWNALLQTRSSSSGSDDTLAQPAISRHRMHCHLYSPAIHLLGPTARLQALKPVDDAPLHPSIPRIQSGVLQVRPQKQPSLQVPRCHQTCWMTQYLTRRKNA